MHACVVLCLQSQSIPFIWLRKHASIQPWGWNVQLGEIHEQVVCKLDKCVDINKYISIYHYLTFSFSCLWINFFFFFQLTLELYASIFYKLSPDFLQLTQWTLSWHCHQKATSDPHRIEHRKWLWPCDIFCHLADLKPAGSPLSRLDSTCYTHSCMGTHSRYW